MPTLKNSPVTRVPEHFLVDFSARYAGGLGSKAISVFAPPGPSDGDLMYIAGQHYADPVKFQNMLGAFFPSGVPTPATYSLAKMQQYIHDAGDGKIQFAYDESDHTSNNMTLTAMPFNAKPVYSAYLFRGILLKYPAITEFHFYKAIDSGVFTVAIAAVNGSQILYTGELSELYP